MGLEEKFELGSNEFKALSSETRTQIIKFLKDRNFTLTELAEKTSMSAPSMKEHLNLLTETGFIELQDEGRKWKYYVLTRKGKKLFEENKLNFLIVLSIASIALIGLLIAVFFNLSAGQAGLGQKAYSISAEKSFGESLETKQLPIEDNLGTQRNLETQTGISDSSDNASKTIDTNSFDEID